MDILESDKVYLVKAKERLEDLRRLDEQFAQAKQRYANDRVDALQALDQALLRIDLDDDDLVKPFLIDLYWNFPDIAVRDIAYMFCMKVPEVQALVRNEASGLKCKTCAGQVRYASRTDRAQSDGICQECKQAEALRQQEEQNKRWEQYQRQAEAELEQQQQESQEEQDLRGMEYSDYLQTDHWKATRKAAFRRAGYACQLCNDRGKLQVHHRTYVRRGNESPDDLIVLCAECHEHFHHRGGEVVMPKSRIPEHERYV